MNSKHFLFAFLILFTSNSKGQTRTSLQFIPANHPSIQYIGRVDKSNPTSVRFSYPGVTIRLKFEGDVCFLHLKNALPGTSNYYTLLIDSLVPNTIKIGAKDCVIPLSLNKKGIHELQIFKRTESFVGEAIFEGIDVEKGKQLLPIPSKLTRKIEFIGNSITCGYGNEGDSPTCSFSPETENNYMAYGAITARLLQADYVAVAYSGKGLIQNFDLQDKETMPILYDRVIPSLPLPKWDFSSWIPDMVVVNLGTNDFAHSAPDSIQFVTAYLQFLEKIRNNYPDAYLFCIEGCMTKDDWPKGIPSLSIVKKYIVAAVLYFRTKGQKKVEFFFPSSMQQGEIGCDWHPKISRHQKMADELSTFIREKTGW